MIRMIRKKTYLFIVISMIFIDLMKYIYSLINFYLMEHNTCELFIDKKR